MNKKPVLKTLAIGGGLGAAVSSVTLSTLAYMDKSVVKEESKEVIDVSEEEIKRIEDKINDFKKEIKSSYEKTRLALKDLSGEVSHLQTQFHAEVNGNEVERQIQKDEYNELKEQAKMFSDELDKIEKNMNENAELLNITMIKKECLNT